MSGRNYREYLALMEAEPATISASQAAIYR